MDGTITNVKCEVSNLLQNKEFSLTNINYQQSLTGLLCWLYNVGVGILARNGISSYTIINNNPYDWFLEDLKLSFETSNGCFAKHSIK